VLIVLQPDDVAGGLAGKLSLIVKKQPKDGRVVTPARR
jgi:hypothetical protein